MSSRSSAEKARTPSAASLVWRGSCNPLTPRVYYEGGRPVALSEPRLVE